jgi:hypothetical protein
MTDTEKLQSGDFIPRSAGNYADVHQSPPANSRRSPWCGGETAAFLDRVSDAKCMMWCGRSQEEIREKHGSVVLRAAKEKR